MLLGRLTTIPARSYAHSAHAWVYVWPYISGILNGQNELRNVVSYSRLVQSKKQLAGNTMQVAQASMQEGRTIMLPYRRSFLNKYYLIPICNRLNPSHNSQ
jgi:hypothetical protein